VNEIAGRAVPVLASVLVVLALLIAAPTLAAARVR